MTRIYLRISQINAKSRDLGFRYMPWPYWGMVAKELRMVTPRGSVWDDFPIVMDNGWSDPTLPVTGWYT